MLDGTYIYFAISFVSVRRTDRLEVEVGEVGDFTSKKKREEGDFRDWGERRGKGGEEV